ncbi:hypothetical protein [Cereibacter sphaeroides]|uniref:hypothetical protein n=1 Tax=Cereibacter sphaeroides TaxID=1063 RepID=UPI001F2AE43F|nr:hypothetical protein [Cereibacter sphaeroides]MCE6953231.1 hypothetical protein [Cereibacter sphaeroides]MCE6968070.1 hypothetical protein [Cereibacter sphaeroides]
MTTFRTGLMAGVSALLATVASAQTTTSQGTTMGQDWEAPVVDTFFNPGGSLTLRTEAEIRESWASLGEAQKQKVRDDCASFGTADGAATAPSGAGGATSTGSSGGASPSPGVPVATDTGGAASPTGQPTGDTAAHAADDTTGDPDTKVSNVGESDATTADMGTSAGPGTSDERVTAAEQAQAGGPDAEGTGATTNPDAGMATTGSGEGTYQGTSTSAAGATGAAQGERRFDSASVSLTSWTQICQMVEKL